MKRVISLLLAAVLAVGMQASALALNSPQKIKALHERFSEQIAVIGLDGDDITDAQSPPARQLADLRVRAGSQLRIYLTGRDDSLFLDQNGEYIPTADVTLSRLRAARVEPEAFALPEEIVESVELAYGRSDWGLPGTGPYIEVRFAGDFVSVDDYGFHFSVALSVGGEIQEQTRLEISGVMQVDIMEISSGNRMDLSEGTVALATETIPGVDIALGDGVVLTTDLVRGEKYYGVARLLEPSESGGLQLTYELRTINLDRPATTVRIITDTTLHVYDEQGVYLGTTRDALAYSEHYHLKSRRT